MSITHLTLHFPHPISSFINGSTKWDDYRFYHWSGIDYFCYFSHAFCTIPPYGWLQAAHRHGVRVIGTLITESAVGRRTLDALLASEQTVSTAVDALVHLAVHCRFEGWLINIECDLDRDQIPLLTYFVQLLHNRMHAAVPHALVIWYDSILTSGQLLWQNELNQRNRGFYDVCDGILLNYNWNDGHLARTVQQLDYDAAKVANVFVGIDVFGRGQVAKDRTHETWQRIRQANASLSVGLFAPAWTFEGATELGVNIHAPHGTAVCNAYFVECNELFWDRLWPMLWSTGPTRMPFATTFCLGSGRRRYRDGLTLQASVLDGWFNMAMQSWQPSVTGGAHRRRPHFLEAFDGGSCLEVDSTTNEEQNEASTTGANFRNGPMVARLFVCDFGGDDVRDGFVLCYAYKAQTLNGGDGFAVWLKAEMSDDNGSKRYCRIECGAPFSVRPQGQSSSQTIGRRSVRLAPLTDGALRDVLIHIVERRERSLPAYSLPAASGWMVRYYYVPIGGGVRLIDVGVRNASDDHGGAAVLLGAVQLHRGSAALWHRQRRQAVSGADGGIHVFFSSDSVMSNWLSECVRVLRSARQMSLCVCVRFFVSGQTTFFCVRSRAEAARADFLRTDKCGGVVHKHQTHTLTLSCVYN